MKNLYILTVFLACCTFVGGSSRFASDDKARQSVSVLTRYSYLQTSFTPARPARPGDTPGSPESPEQAAIRVVLQMQAGNFDAWLKTWDEDAQRTHMERARPKDGAAPARTREQWLDAWKALAGREIVLVAKAETPDFVLVAIEVWNARPDGTTPNPDEKPLLSPSLRFRLVGREWQQTMKFSDHPVVQLWRTGRTSLELEGEYEKDKKTRMPVEPKAK